MMCTIHNGPNNIPRCILDKVASLSKYYGGIALILFVIFSWRDICLVYIQSLLRHATH